MGVLVSKHEDPVEDWLIDVEAADHFFQREILSLLFYKVHVTLDQIGDQDFVWYTCIPKIVKRVHDRQRDPKSTQKYLELLYAITSHPGPSRLGPTSVGIDRASSTAGIAFAGLRNVHVSNPARADSRRDLTTFASARANVGVVRGKHYFEVKLGSGGDVMVGWSTIPAFESFEGCIGCGHLMQSYSINLSNQSDSRSSLVVNQNEGSSSADSTNETISESQVNFNLQPATDFSTCQPPFALSDGNALPIDPLALSFVFGGGGEQRGWKRGDRIGVGIDLTQGNVSFYVEEHLVAQVAMCNQRLIDAHGYFPCISLSKGQSATFVFSGVKNLPSGFSPLEVSAAPLVILQDPTGSVQMLSAAGEELTNLMNAGLDDMVVTVTSPPTTEPLAGGGQASSSSSSNALIDHDHQKYPLWPSSSFDLLLPLLYAVEDNVENATWVLKNLENAAKYEANCRTMILNGALDVCISCLHITANESFTGAACSLIRRFLSHVSAKKRTFLSYFQQCLPTILTFSRTSCTKSQHKHLTSLLPFLFPMLPNDTPFSEAQYRAIGDALNGWVEASAAGGRVFSFVGQSAMISTLCDVLLENLNRTVIKDFEPIVASHVLSSLISFAVHPNAPSKLTALVLSTLSSWTWQSPCVCRHILGSLIGQWTQLALQHKLSIHFVTATFNLFRHLPNDPSHARSALQEPAPHRPPLFPEIPHGETSASTATTTTTLPCILFSLLCPYSFGAVGTGSGLGTCEFQAQLFGCLKLLVSNGVYQQQLVHSPNDLRSLLTIVSKHSTYSAPFILLGKLARIDAVAQAHKSVLISTAKSLLSASKPFAPLSSTPPSSPAAAARSVTSPLRDGATTTAVIGQLKDCDLNRLLWALYFVQSLAPSVSRELIFEEKSFLLTVFANTHSHQPFSSLYSTSQFTPTFPATSSQCSSNSSSPMLSAGSTNSTVPLASHLHYGTKKSKIPIFSKKLGVAESDGASGGSVNDVRCVALACLSCLLEESGARGQSLTLSELQTIERVLSSPISSPCIFAPSTTRSTTSPQKGQQQTPSAHQIKLGDSSSLGSEAGGGSGVETLPSHPFFVHVATRKLTQSDAGCMLLVQSRVLESVDVFSSKNDPQLILYFVKSIHCFLKRHPIQCTSLLYSHQYLHSFVTLALFLLSPIPRSLLPPPRNQPPTETNFSESKSPVTMAIPSSPSLPAVLPPSSAFGRQDASSPLTPSPIGLGSPILGLGNNLSAPESALDLLGPADMPSLRQQLEDLKNCESFSTQVQNVLEKNLQMNESKMGKPPSPITLSQFSSLFENNPAMTTERSPRKFQTGKLKLERNSSLGKLSLTPTQQNLGERWAFVADSLVWKDVFVQFVKVLATVCDVWSDDKGPQEFSSQLSDLSLLLVDSHVFEKAESSGVIEQFSPKIRDMWSRVKDCAYARKASEELSRK